MTSSDRQVAFIFWLSGPLDTGNDACYFHAHCAARIDAAISRGDHFVIGLFVRTPRVARPYHRGCHRRRGPAVGEEVPRDEGQRACPGADPGRARRIGLDEMVREDELDF